MKKVTFIYVPRSEDDENEGYYLPDYSDDPDVDQVEITLTDKQEKSLQHMFKKFRETQDFLREKVEEATLKRKAEEYAREQERAKVLKEALSSQEYELVMKYRQSHFQSLCTVAVYNIKSPASFLEQEMRI